MLWGKPKLKCLMCDGKIKGDEYAEIKFHCADGDGVAHICNTCADKLDEQQKEQKDGEPV